MNRLFAVLAVKTETWNQDLFSNLVWFHHLWDQYKIWKLYSVIYTFSLPRSKCCNLIDWWSVKISWSWHFEVPRRYFLKLGTQQSKRRNANNGSCLLRETASLLTFIMKVISVNFIACFLIICWFLQTLNYRGNEQNVLVLVQCHDGMIKNLINLVRVLHSSSTRARPNRLILSVTMHRIMTLDSNQNLKVMVDRLSIRYVRPTPEPWDTAPSQSCRWSGTQSSPQNCYIKRGIIFYE